MKNSKFLRLNAFDFIKGLIIAVITGALTSALQMFSKVPPSLNLEQIGVACIISAISFLLTQLHTDEVGNIKLVDIGGRPRRKPRKPRKPNDNEIECDDYGINTGDTLIFFSDMENIGIAITVLTVEPTQLGTVNLVLAQNIPFNDFNSIEFELS